MKRILILSALIFTPSVALAQGPTYSFSNVTPVPKVFPDPYTVATAQQDSQGRWVIQVSATCTGAGQMASVNSGTATVTAGMGTSDVTFTNPPMSTLSGTVGGVIVLPRQPTTPYLMTVTFTFGVYGSPSTKSTSTTFTVQ